MTRKILTYSPHCAEALYEDILSQFRKGKGAIAAHQLIKLVKKSREYYIHALIDPELSKFRDLIHPRVKALLEEARDEAEKTILEAREELEDLRRWLGRDETETQEAETLFSKMEELSKVDGYFSHLDVIHYGGNLVGRGRATLEERRKAIKRVFQELVDRHEQHSSYLKAYPYRFLTATLSHELRQMGARISRDWGADAPGGVTQYKELFAAADRLSTELDILESRLQRLERMRKVLSFLRRFLKKTLLFQSANLLLAVILFPIVIYYMNLLIPGLGISHQNIWSYQKTMLTLGAFSALLMALVTSGGSPSHKGTP